MVLEYGFRAQLRYSGSDTTIEVPLSTPATMRRAFESAHKSRFGFIDRAKALVIEAVSVEAVGGAARLAERVSVDAVADRVGRAQRARLQPARATRFFLWAFSSMGRKALYDSAFRPVNIVASGVRSSSCRGAGGR